MGPAKRLFRVLEDPEGRKRDPSIGASSAVTFLRVPGRWGWAGLAGPSEKIRSEAVGSPGFIFHSPAISTLVEPELSAGRDAGVLKVLHTKS